MPSTTQGRDDKSNIEIHLLATKDNYCQQQERKWPKLPKLLRFKLIKVKVVMKNKDEENSLENHLRPY